MNIWKFAVRIPLLNRLGILKRKLILKKHPGLFIDFPVDIIEIGGEIQYASKNAIGKNSTLILKEGAVFRLGCESWVGKNVVIEPLPGKTISLGDFTSIQDGCKLLGEITIGSHVLFAPNVFVSSGNHTFNLIPHLPIQEQDKIVNADPAYAKIKSNAICIEDDCWIGINAVLFRGITIGKGAVIGANSVVKKDVAPYTIVGGSPARVIKQRLDFDPPSSLAGNELRHFPYFYNGFSIDKDDLNFPLKCIRDHALVILKKQVCTAIQISGLNLSNHDCSLSFSAHSFRSVKIELKKNAEFSLILIKETNSDEINITPAKHPEHLLEHLCLQIHSISDSVSVSQGKRAVYFSKIELI